jgi:hypothetical protein
LSALSLIFSQKRANSIKKQYQNVCVEFGGFFILKNMDQDEIVFVEAVRRFANSLVAKQRGTEGPSQTIQEGNHVFNLHIDARPERLAYTTEETASLLGISPASVMRLNERDLLKSSKALRTEMYSRREIERFLQDTT